MTKRLVPAGLSTSAPTEAAAPFELPSAAAREARRRVRIAAAMAFGAYTVFLLLLLPNLRGRATAELQLNLVHDGMGIALCGALLVVTLMPWISNRAVLRVALAAEVLLCWLISWSVLQTSFLRTGHVATLTWVVPIVILFPLLVSVRPGTSIAVSMLSVLTGPAALLLLSKLGRIPMRWADVLSLLVTGAVAVGIAATAARTIHGARRRIAQLERVGSYELIEPLGRGGMGQVWRAHHALLARPAAVKLIRAEQLQGALEARDAAMQRFTREARVTAGLRSPHTIELYDFGAAPDGALYYAMELLDGMNLEHFVYQHGALVPARAVNWLVQACHSLGEAHAQGLIHRDIKPANLFVCRYGRDLDFVKVLDFGLTRPVAHEKDATLTAAGERPGTAGYMAPEQVFGLECEPRTDLYALGCVGYFLLAGRKPFEADSAGELMRQHAQSPPPPLAGAAPQPVPARLEAVLMSCLSKSPDQRPASADALAVALEASLDPPAWSATDAQAWWAARA